MTLGERPSTSSELALHLQLNERWVREWLHQQTCVGQLEYLADGAIAGSRRRPMRCWPMRIIRPISWADSIPRSRFFPHRKQEEESFRTGIGMSYDEHGPNCARGIERMGDHHGSIGVGE